MNYDQMILEEAIKAACRYDGYVDNNHYYILMKYASINGRMGQDARDAIATAKRYDYYPFRYVDNRDLKKEEDLARMGSPKYW